MNFMPKTELLIKKKKSLEYFNKYVIQQSRTNLTKGDHNVNKQLYNSLKAELNVSKKGIEKLSQGVRITVGPYQALCSPEHIERTYT